MVESKQLVHMAITAMLGAMILAAVVGLITLGYNMWGAFSKQEAVNKRVSDYAKYAAFDNTDVRGQDVISLITQTKGDILIFIVGPDNNSTASVTGYENGTNASLIGMFANDTSLHSEIYDTFNKLALKFEGTSAVTNSDAKVSTVAKCDDLAPLFTTGSTSIALRCNYSSADPDFGRRDLQEIQAYFLDRAGRWKAIGADPTNVHSNKEYIMYRSNLIYDPNTSSEIVGVLFTEKGFQ